MKRASSTGVASRAGDVRTRILSAATRQIGARGFDGMTLQSVADAVGIRKPSVLHHFPSKEELRQAVLADIWEHWSKVVPRLLRGAMEHANGFELMMGELVGFFSEDPDRARLLIRDGQRQGMCHAELDPEGHLLQILELILISTAWGDISADGPASAPHESRRRVPLRLGPGSVSALGQSRPSQARRGLWGPRPLRQCRETPTAEAGARIAAPSGGVTARQPEGNHHEGHHR
jgi:AcrR family transcriptional regulator